eukprot:7593315-Prorocentrum_lima.AAC.1
MWVNMWSMCDGGYVLNPQGCKLTSGRFLMGTCTQPTGIWVDCWLLSYGDVYSTHKDVGRRVVDFYS